MHARFFQNHPIAGEFGFGFCLGFGSGIVQEILEARGIIQQDQGFPIAAALPTLILLNDNVRNNRRAAASVGFVLGFMLGEHLRSIVPIPTSDSRPRVITG